MSGCEEFNPMEIDFFTISIEFKICTYPHSTLPNYETILENRLIVAIDEHQVRIQRSDEKVGPSSTTRKNLAWFVTLQVCAL